MSAWAPWRQMKRVWDESRQSLHACKAEFTSPASEVLRPRIVILVLLQFNTQVTLQNLVVETYDKQRRGFWDGLATSILNQLHPFDV